MGMRQAFTSYNNSRGNADTERFMHTLKEEPVWINDWTSPTAFFEAPGRWIEEYNSSYLHLALGYNAPEQFERENAVAHTHLAEAC